MKQTIILITGVILANQMKEERIVWKDWQTNCSQLLLTLSALLLHFPFSKALPYAGPSAKSQSTF